MTGIPTETRPAVDGLSMRCIAFGTSRFGRVRILIDQISGPKISIDPFEGWLPIEFVDTYNCSKSASLPVKIDIT